MLPGKSPRDSPARVNCHGSESTSKYGALDLAGRNLVDFDLAARLSLDRWTRLGTDDLGKLIGRAHQ